jgi:hypothetical protein
MSSASTTGFRLDLQNNQRWRIVGVDGMVDLAAWFASIMGLKSQPGSENATLVMQPWKRAPSQPDATETVELLPDGAKACYPALLRFRPGTERRAEGRLFYPTILRILLPNGAGRVVFEVDEDFDHPWGDLTHHSRKRLWRISGLAILRHAVYTLYCQAQHAGGLPVHSALVTRDGLGVLLVGDGGTGKSTCCRRLPSPWEALSDDEVLVVRDEHGRYQAHPFPTWSNLRVQEGRSSWCAERSVPLAAVFFLEQADRDDVIPMGQGHAALSISQAAWQVWGGCSKALRSCGGGGESALGLQIIDNSCCLAKSVPAFALRVSLDGRFWENVERVLSELSPAPQ